VAKIAGSPKKEELGNKLDEEVYLVCEDFEDKQEKRNQRHAASKRARCAKETDIKLRQTIIKLTSDAVTAALK
jgi:hypothetical protein